MNTLQATIENKMFTELNSNFLLEVNGGIDWGKVAVSAAIGGAAGAVSGGIAFASAGTVVMPVIGTVSGAAAGAIVVGSVGAVAGAAKSIWKQLW